jgi:hypothetical protein
MADVFVSYSKATPEPTRDLVASRTDRGVDLGDSLFASRISGRKSGAANLEWAFLLVSFTMICNDLKCLLRLLNITRQQNLR